MTYHHLQHRRAALPSHTLLLQFAIPSELLHIEAVRALATVGGLAELALAALDASVWRSLQG